MTLNKAKLFVLLLVLKGSLSSILAKVDQVTPEENEVEAGKSSLVFVFDTTGSMYNDLKQLREGAEMILNTALEESDIIGDFVFVPFHDPAVGPATVTRDKEVFKTALELVNVYGGGDCPEKSLGGIQLALNVSEPRSFIYVFTDATAGDHRLVGRVLDAVQRKQSQVVFILTGHCNDLEKPTYKVYQQIAAASSGQVFNLNKTSVHKVLDFVKSSIKGRMVNLGSSVIPAGYNFTQEIPVDSSLGEVTVSVSGAKPQITVVNPSGEQLTGPPQLVTTLDLSEIMVVKVIQPEPGNWSITVGSEEEYSVKVVGTSNLTFNHGFSVQPPRGMLETSYRPLKGTYNHMLISLSQANSPVKVNYAEILTLAGKTLFELPLTEVVDGRSKMYRAEAFIPPDEFFYIAINGKDKNDQEVRRIGTTAVQAKLPDVPYLSVSRKVEAHSHSRVVLKCKVESLVPVTSFWTKDAAKIQKLSTLQTTTIEYVIEDMTEQNVGTYRCVAENVAGVSRAATDLSLLVDPPQVSMEPSNVVLEMGSDANISCTVFSETLLQKFQFVSNTNESHEVIDIAVEPNMEGMYTYNITVEDATEADAATYTCVAANRGGTSSKTSVIQVQSKPTAQILGSHEVSAKLHDIVSLYCLVQNSDAISWINSGTVRKQVDVKGTYTDFLSVNVTDDGDWTCKAVKGRFEGSDSVHISALLNPVVAIQGIKNVTVLNGTSVEIVCEVIAKPQPRIVWYRGSEEKFLNHTTTALDLKTYKSVLKLKSFAEDVNGTYFCVGENSVGIHQDSVVVLVRRKMTLVQGFNDTSVQLYYQVELHCDVDSHPPAQISWYHNGTLLTVDHNLHLSDDHKTLYISRVEFDNLGSYTCEADNGFEKIQVVGSLKVVGLDVPVLGKDYPAKRIVKRGESTIITCRVLLGSPEPSLKWQYRSAKGDNFTTLYNVTSEDLIINNVTIANGGVYRCVAENVLGRDEFSVELVVHYPPQFVSAKQSEVDQTQKPVEVEAGETVTLTCEAVGMPPPIVTWNKNGRPMVYGKRSYLRNMSLILDTVNEYDSGVFTCIANTPMGSVQKIFTLFVYVPPKISTPNTGSEQEILEGQLVELPCEASGVPSPEVLWNHNGKVVTDARKYIDEFGIRFIANLTDFGDYTCVVTNRFGNTSLSYSLFIWVPPYIEPLEGSTNVLIGENAALQCDVVGFPLPRVQWEFKKEILKENTTRLSFNDVGNLYIVNTSAEHEGAYVCIAENVAGVARRLTYLNVNEPPKIIEDNYTGPYLATNMDSAVAIGCKVTGKPKPYVLWSKDDIYLDKDVRYEVEADGTLTLKSPTEDMSGNYTCIAKNAVGKDNKTVQVMVYSLPVQMQAEESRPVVTIMEHTHANVECPTRASHTDTVKWYKDAALVSTGKLQIANVTRSDQSTYACVVTNAVGSAYSAISLSVEWPPTFLGDDENDDDAENNESSQNIAKAETKTTVRETINISDAVNNEDSTPNDRAAPEYTTKDIKINTNGTNNTKVLTENVKTASENVKSRRKNYDNRVETVQVVKGDDTYFDCSVDAKPIAKTKWLFNSKPIVFESRERLKLMSVQVRHAGQYRCVVSNAHGTILKEFRLHVLEPPYISEFEVLDVLLMEGDNATLECNAKGSPEPTLQWTFNNTNWQVDKSSVTTSNISRNSEGLFRCDARNDAGATHIVYRVSVVSGAKIEDVVAYRGGQGGSVNRTVELEQNSHLRIACKASGNPPPVIHWVRNGMLLATNLPDVEYADLSVEGARVAQGTYTCVASNEGGSEERKIALEVLEPPKIFQTLFETENDAGTTMNLEVLSGQAYYLHCHAYGNPVPELYWFRDGVPLMLFDDSMVSTEFGEVIEVKQAMESQSGNYTCVARNKAGNTSMAYLVDVLVPPPQSKESSRPVRSRYGKQLSLTCPVHGSPTPYVTWHKHPYTEIGESTPRVTLTDDAATLIINSSVVSDSGNYSCVMANKVGTTEVVFNVTIEKPPSIAGNVGPDLVENHEVSLRKSIVLKCEADGHPLPKISWLKDTQHLSNNLSNINRVLGNSLLAIWSVTSRDAGQYICIVENDAGTAHRRFNVVVRVPGKWNTWGQWSYCNVTCGLGHQQRSRTCQYIDENNNIIDKSSTSDKFVLDESACKGPSDEKRKCHMPSCEDQSSGDRWSAWSRWLPCSASCGSGTQARTRRCNGKQCLGDNVQIRKCPGLPSCNDDRDKTGNDVFDTNEEQNENNAYAPEAVFEMEPEIVNSHYSPDVEEFYLATGSKQSTAYYDVKVISNLDGSERGPCDAGYGYNTSANACDDIDECVIESNECHSTQVCENVSGAYRCTCSPGLLSLGAGQRCMDINECTQDISGCEYACVNVVGGYVCACPAHMRLHADKHHCYVVHAASSYRKPHSYEDLDTGEYLSTSVEYPARYKHMRNN